MTQRNSYTAWVGWDSWDSLGRVRTAKFGAQQYFAWKAQKLPLPELWKSPGPGHRAYSTGATQGEVD